MKAELMLQKRCRSTLLRGLRGLNTKSCVVTRSSSSQAQGNNRVALRSRGKKLVTRAVAEPATDVAESKAEEK